MAEYESTLHDAGTIYNYRLILLDFYEDFGVSKDSVQPLKDEITTLENKRGLKRKDGSFQKNQANFQKVKEKILRIQANTF
ncbi:MAG TPA: hypothetical protein VN739_07170, partial [Nitrososphaerales archaeon]|nr:hypothetical protein [Nitrososphaerales archaeon]